MTKLPYYHVDAFASRPFTGNQAAVMPLDSWLPDAVMQAIGNENNFAETAFYIPDDTGAADYELRWFTPEVEIRLCGHATLASGYIILTANPEKDQVTFRTRKAGILEVRREKLADGTDGYAVALPLIATAELDAPEMAAAIGGTPLEIRGNDDRYKLFRFASAAEVLALKPDMKALAMMGDDNISATAPDDGTFGTDIVTRVFVPGAGVDEDSVTGSAHAVLAPYWTRILGRDHFTAYQASQRGGYLECRLEEDMVWLSGQCVTVVEGLFNLG